MIAINMLDGNAFSHLSLDSLRTFVAAARLGNFTRAGEEVARSQSAVSMQMKRLEEDLGCALFERGGRKVALTPDGDVLLGYARRLLKLNDEAVSTLSAPRVRGVVRLGVPDDYATKYLPRVLSRFARAYPMVRVDVRCEATPRLVRGVEEGALDLCLATSDGAAGSAGAGREMARIPLVWICARGLGLSDIRRQGEPLPLAVFHEGCVHRKWALASLEREHIPYRIAFATVSLSALKASVRSGHTVAPVAAGSAGSDFREISMDEGLPVLPSVTVNLHRREGADCEAVERLEGFVEECFG